MLRHHSEQLSIPWGEMSIKEKDFILGGESKSSKAKGPDFVFGIILTHLLMTKGEEITSRALMIPFLAIHAKGGESMSPKQKDRTTTNFKNLVFQKIFFNWYRIVFKRGRK